MEKVKVTQTQADAIEMLKAKGDTLSRIVGDYFRDTITEVNGYSSLYDLLSDELIRALYIGYEVEETPEDKVREFHRSFERGKDKYHDGNLNAIVVTLNLLNIKIEGVNT